MVRRTCVSRARARISWWALALGAFGLSALGVSALSPGAALAAGTCSLPNGVQHVVILQFDNVHSERDNPNVPSDLEQMPALRSFITGNGTLLTNDHTVLISHTSGGIVSTETGLYPDRNGITVGNTYVFSEPSQASGSGFSSAFKYWTDPTSATADNKPTLITTGGKNTPAPWVPYTSHGCDFAKVGFPGFDGMEANNALGYTAAAQEAGIPVTYTYLSDVHDDHYDQNKRDAFGPGEAGMEAQLKSTTRPSARSSSASRRMGSTRPTRCSWSPSTRATTSVVASR